MTIKVRVTEGDKVRHVCEYEPTAKNAIIGYFVGTDLNGNDIYSDDKILVYDIARYGTCEPHVEIAGENLLLLMASRFIAVVNVRTKFII